MRRTPLTTTPRRSTIYDAGERPSVCLSRHSITDAACGGGFAAERRAGRRYRLTAAVAGRPAAAAPQHGAQQQMRAVSR